MHVAAPPGDPTRLFVVEQGGRVQLVKGGAKQAQPFADLGTEVLAGGERGLLSIAFPPDYAASGLAYVYLTATLDAATWGAELALGEGRGRIYIVEPTGPIEDDPNLTDKRYPGNPTKSYRSREPLRVTGEVTDWQGHSPEALKAMKDGIERLKRLGVEPIDD